MSGKVTSSVSEPIGCEGATSEIIVGRISDGGIIEIFVNGQGLGLSHPYREGAASALLGMGIEMIPLDANGNVLTIESLVINDLAERAHFINHTNQYKQIQIVLGDASQVKNNYTPANQSFNYDSATQITTFCLAPATTLTGFRIRTSWTMTKSDQLHTYRPENAGTNGEKVINLANLFDDETFKDADGWSMWSRELTFEDINFVNSNGGVTIVFNSEETPNYWFDFSAITTLSQFFDLLAGSVEYVDNT